MRAAPPCQVSLNRFGAWRLGVLFVASLAVAVLLAWLIAHERPIGTAVAIVVMAASTAFAVLGWRLARCKAVELRWDGLAWHLGPSTDDALPGDVSIAFDLGPWMLLRFLPTARSAPVGVVWLPVQRHGLEAQWHALRCAIYSPRPALASETPASV